MGIVLCSRASRTEFVMNCPTSECGMHTASLMGNFQSAFRNFDVMEIHIQEQSAAAGISK